MIYTKKHYKWFISVMKQKITLGINFIFVHCIHLRQLRDEICNVEFLYLREQVLGVSSPFIRVIPKELNEITY